MIACTHGARVWRPQRLGAIALAVISGCTAIDGPEGTGVGPGNDPSALLPSTLRVVVEEGQAQFVPEGNVTPLDVRLRVIDFLQRPRAGVRLRVSVAEGGGQIADSVTTTDRFGTAVLPAWRVGPAGRPQRVLVRLGDSTLDLHATSHAERLGVPFGRMLLRRGADILEWRAGAPAPAAMANVPTGYALAAVSPDERLLAVFNREDPSEVCVVQVGALQRRCMRAPERFTTAYPPSGFSWSPDGRHLVFDAQRGESDVCPLDCPPLFSTGILDVASMDFRWLSERLTLWPLSASWSPDGRLLAYVQGDTLRLAGPDGRTIRDVARLGESVYASDLRWSPDGHRIAASLTIFGPNLYDRGVGIVDVRTGAVALPLRVRDSNPHVLGAVRWSPDGSLLAFGWHHRESTTGSDVFTLPVTGNGLTRVAVGTDLIEWR